MKNFVFIVGILICPLATAQSTGTWKMESADTASNGKVYKGVFVLSCSADGTGTVQYTGTLPGPSICSSSGNELEVKNWGSLNPIRMDELNKTPTFHAKFFINGKKIEGESILDGRNELFTEGYLIEE